MGLTVTVLLLAAAALMCLGVAIGVTLSRRERRAATSAVNLAGLAGTDTAVPVLTALCSTVVVPDDDDEVLRASASAYTFNIVHDDAVIEPTMAAMVGRVWVSGQAQDAVVTVAREGVSGADQFHLQVRVAGIGQGRVLILIEDHTTARRVEAIRRDFVANISHKLKTPVGAIQLLAETVGAGTDDPDFVRDYSGRMRKEACCLGVLVQEIIELTRLQKGDALAEPEVVDIDDVVAKVMDRARIEADGRQVALVAGGTKGLRVRGDAALITTAVRNLLDNATRYSEPRTRVLVGILLDAENPDIVRIAMVDQGIGIPKEEQERVFERFYRVDKARSRATGGTGLGLSIVKHVAADHGGTVELWSAPGRGSTFTLVLPRLGEGEPMEGELIGAGSAQDEPAQAVAERTPRSGS